MNRRTDTSPPPASTHGRAFQTIARTSARAAGHPWGFGIAVGVLILWAVSGPIFGFSDTWQLIINTATTIITFLMVFLIQNTQNRDSEAMQLKLDELIRSTEKSHNALLDIEELSPEELDRIKSDYAELASNARASLRNGHSDRGCPEMNSNGVTTGRPKIQRLKKVDSTRERRRR